MLESSRNIERIITLRPIIVPFVGILFAISKTRTMHVYTCIGNISIPLLGVQSAAVSVICELARKNPRNYLSLAPVFFKLLTTSSNNWMLIKIIKLVSSCSYTCS